MSAGDDQREVQGIRQKVDRALGGPIMNEIEKSRLGDFKRILTYRIVTKIVHDFKGDY